MLHYKQFHIAASRDNHANDDQSIIGWKSVQLYIYIERGIISRRYYIHSNSIVQANIRQKIDVELVRTIHQSEIA